MLKRRARYRWATDWRFDSPHVLACGNGRERPFCKPACKRRVLIVMPKGERAPAFEPGNEAAVKHGAWSNRAVDPVAVAVIEAVLARRPDLERHPEALAAWGRAEARCLVLAEHFAKVGYFDEELQERPGLRYVAQWARLAADLGARLGLDPRAEAELVTLQAEAAREVVDLDAIRERGRQALRKQT